MVMHANEFETKEKQKLTEIKNKLQHIHVYSPPLVEYCLIFSLLSEIRKEILEQCSGHTSSFSLYFCFLVEQ